MEDELPLQHSFLKWAGGKLKLVNEIKKLLPPTIDQFCEPFAGAGSLALNVSANRVILSDVNKDLIDTWMAVRDQPKDLLKEIDILFSGRFNTEVHYYELRKEFNETSYGIRKSALFIYLNKHGYNGMCRYSREGVFNIPYGRYDKDKKVMEVGSPCDRILEVSKRIQKWKIFPLDFRTVLRQLKEGSVAYCDPPFVTDVNVQAISETKNGKGFTAYAPGDFNMFDQQDLAAIAKEAKEKGVTVLISNHDTPETRELYTTHGATISYFQTQRTIAASAAKRRKASELLAIFKP